MKKVSAFIASSGLLINSFFASVVMAQPLNDAINIVPPDKRAIPGDTQLNTIFQNAINIVFIIAALAVLVMLIWGAIEWITSGGDKDKVGNARKRIVNALIGLAILALAFLILSLVSQLLGINIVGGKIPSLVSPLTATPRPT